MKFGKVLLVAPLLLTSAFAEEAVQSLSFEQLKDSCSNPGRYNNQVAPSQIRISCENHIETWVASEAAEQFLPQTRSMATAIISNKYEVKREEANLDLDDQGFSCPQFKQVRRDLSVERAVTCKDLLSFEGTLAEYCEQVISETSERNPESVTETDTGVMVSSCGLSQFTEDSNQE